MRKLLSVFTCTALLCGAVACTEEEMQQSATDVVDVAKEEIEFVASGEPLEEGEDMSGTPSTRTLIREGNDIYWTANDAISLFTANGTGGDRFVTKDGGTTANFVGETVPTGRKYMLYPYNQNAVLEIPNVTTTLHAQQYVERGSFAAGMNIMTLISDNETLESLPFKNNCSYFRFSISEEYKGRQIKTVRFRSNTDDEPLAGTVRINMTEEEPSAVVIADPEMELSMTAAEYIIPGGYYFFVLAPGTYSSLTITLVDDEGATWSHDYSNITFSRNHINRHHNIMPGEFTKQTDYEVDESNNRWNVYTAKGLYEWAAVVNAGDYDLGCFLMNDVNMEDDPEERTWIPAGSVATPYVGTFDGNNKTISNLVINGTDDVAERGIGFIGALGTEEYNGENVKIANVSFVNPKVSSAYEGDMEDMSDDGFVGVVVGRVNVPEEGNYRGVSVINCHVTGATVSGGENVGGIIGRSYGNKDLIDNCSFTGTVSGSRYVGGIAGVFEGDVQNSSVLNTTIGFDSSTTECRLGGIAGVNSGNLYACIADVVINATGQRYAGAITGANNGTIYACAAVGTINGSELSGGIAGEVYGDIYASYANVDAKCGIFYRCKSSALIQSCYTLRDIDTYFEAPLATVDCSYVESIETVASVLNEALSGTGCSFETGDETFPLKPIKE